MILPLLTAAVLAGAEPASTHTPAPASVQPLAEAAHALEAGRIDQARLMIANAVKAGVRGAALDRLLADLAFASGDYPLALAAYEPLLAANPNDPLLYQRAGIAEIRTGDIDRAALLLRKSTSLPGASWRAWNALGVVADFRRDWDSADAAYARAAELAPTRAEVLNNIGWSLLVRGHWSKAVGPLERAAALDPRAQRIAANLELARAAVSEQLPERRPGESDSDWAARLNDAGMIARLQGDNRKAVAAFARAIEARSQWFERAANNLALVQGAR